MGKWIWNAKGPNKIVTAWEKKWKVFWCKYGHLHNRTGWMGERGSSGGDRAGGVVGVVVSKEQSLRGDFHQC